MRRTRCTYAAAALAAVLLLAGCSGTSTSTSASNPTGSTGTTGTTAGPGSPGFNEPTIPFYQAPNPLPKGAPGEIIRQEPFPGAPSGAQGFRVLYHSTGMNGEDIAVSGVIIVPAGDAPAGGRPIYAWAHGTTGVVDKCAPSTFPTFYDSVVPDLPALLAAGYVVAATDYEGLGTTGVHPYLVGVSEGRGVLDSARVARNLAGANAGTKLLINGHSQGGQASLFAGQLQPEYAKEFTLVGVAAMAPAAELLLLMQAQSNTPYGVILGSYALNAYNAVYGPTNAGMSLDDVLTPAAIAALPQIVSECTTQDNLQALANVALPLTGKFLKTDVGTLSPWHDLLQQNSAGQVKTNAPMFVAQGLKDDLVIPASTATFVKSACALGNTIKYQTYPDATHLSVPSEAMGDITAWMTSLLAGNPPPNTCGSDA